MTAILQHSDSILKCCPDSMGNRNGEPLKIMPVCPWLRTLGDIHNTPVTHTRRTAHVLGDKNWSSASLCVHEFCQDMRRASAFKTNIQRVINKSGV